MDRPSLFSNRLLPNVLGLGLAAFSLPLLVYAVTGWFIRYLADDYCFTGALKLFGFLRAQPWFYLTTSNRFPVIFFVGLGELIGPINIQLWPAFTILLWLAALVVLLRQVRLWLEITWPRLAVPFLAAVILFFTLLEAPDRLQSLYWRSGQLTYSFPLVLFTFNFAWMISICRKLASGQRVSKLAFAGIGLLAFVAGGGSETFNVLQTSLILLGLVLTVLLLKDEQRRSAELILSTVLVGSLLAMLLLVVSPGNERRTSLLPEPPGIVDLTLMSFRYSLDFIIDSVRTQPLPNLLSLLVAGAAGLVLPLPEFRRRTWLLLVALPVLLYLCIVAVVVPSVYAESAYPEYRALMVGRYAMVLLLLTWSFLLGRLFSVLTRGWPVFKYAGLALILLVSLYSLRSAYQSYQALPADRQWAAQWDARDLNIRQQIAEGKSVVEVNEFDSRGSLAEYSSDPTFWVNRCAADYYGLSTITGIP